MTVYLLRECSALDNCYFIEEYETREQALKNMDSYYSYKFIEGQELRLQLTEKENDNGQI